MALVVAQEVPTSASMAVSHGPAGVGKARRRMRDQLRTTGTPEAVIDDAVLILSELLSNACKHGRPLGDALAGDGSVRVAWRLERDGRLTVEVTDGGGPTRPAPAHPSITARGGRGLNIITALADDWGVRDGARGEVTVWAVVDHDDPHGRADEYNGHHRREDFAARVTAPSAGLLPVLGFSDVLERFDELEELDRHDGYDIRDGDRYDRHRHDRNGHDRNGYDGH